ncbi:alpha/beta fold hydrolase [Aurantivibrio infirmus]
MPELESGKGESSKESESSNKKKSREISFQVGDLTIAAQEWGDPGDFPIIALHGWLDNSASFDLLAPLLKNTHLVAIDMAGHGRSSHRAKDSAYLIWQDVGEVYAIADQMGWQQFALLGHSRGAIISTLIAGTFPERITHTALIDGVRPPGVSAEKSPQQLAQSIIDCKRNAQRGSSFYQDLDSAIAARQFSEIPLSYEAAKILNSRGLREVEGGYTWCADPQLKSASGFKLSDEHWHSFIDRATARTKLILAKDGLPRMKQHHEKIAAMYPHFDIEILPGSHHLHVEDNVTGVAEVLNKFFI